MTEQIPLRLRGETAPAWAEAAFRNDQRIIRTFEMVPHWYQDRILPRLTTSETGCHLWTGALSHGRGGGYGVVGLPKAAGDAYSAVVRVHRVTFLHHHGEIGFGLNLDHTCETRACANVAHLEAVDGRDNILRGTGQAAINATKTECPRGHDLTDPANLVKREVGRGRRTCRTCSNIARNQRRTNA
jgi:hypothetical protein